MWKKRKRRGPHTFTSGGNNNNSHQRESRQRWITSPAPPATIRLLDLALWRKGKKEKKNRFPRKRHKNNKEKKFRNSRCASNDWYSSPIINGTELKITARENSYFYDRITSHRIPISIKSIKRRGPSRGLLVPETTARNQTVHGIPNA